MPLILGQEGVSRHEISKGIRSVGVGSKLSGLLSLWEQALYCISRVYMIVSIV